MNHHYDDIRSRVGEPPVWFDEHAVPRYCQFTPDGCANIYAHEVALCDIACQSCGARFLVAFSWDDIEFVQGVPRKHVPLTPADAARLHYGDPPNVRCCPSGPTMNCDDLRVVEFWRKGGDEFTEERNGMRVCSPGYFDWQRIPENEVVMCDHPDFVETL